MVSLCFVSGSCSCTSNGIVCGSLKVNRRSQVYTEGIPFIVVSTFLPHRGYSLHWRIQGGDARDVHPLCPISFIFMLVLVKNWPNNSFSHVPLELTVPVRNPGFATALIKLYPVSSGLCRTTLLYGLRGEV